MNAESNKSAKWRWRFINGSYVLSPTDDPSYDSLDELQSLTIKVFFVRLENHRDENGKAHVSVKVRRKPFEERDIGHIFITGLCRLHVYMHGDELEMEERDRILVPLCKVLESR